MIILLVPDLRTARSAPAGIEPTCVAPMTVVGPEVSCNAGRKRLEHESLLGAVDRAEPL